MTTILHRFCYSDDMGTFGWMDIDGHRTYTVERPWKNNEPFHSCIPEGLYSVEKHNSPKFGRCWILSGDTVGHYNGERTHILIHAANTADQLQGCIAPGIKLGCLGDKWAVLSSRNALSRLNNAMPDKWQLYIKAVTGGKTNYIPA